MQVFQDVRDEGSNAGDSDGSSSSSSSSGGVSSTRRSRPYLRHVSDVRSYLQRSGRSDISDELTRQLMWPASVAAALPATLLEGAAPAAAGAGSSSADVASATSAPWQYFQWQTCHTRVQHGSKARSRGFSMRSAMAQELLPDQRGGGTGGGGSPAACCMTV